MKKVVIVTGGSRGIGAATSKMLAKQGYCVCINYLKRNIEAENLVNEIKELGGQAISIQADVSIESDVQSLFKAAFEEFGVVTHLVNNAGKLFTQTSIENIDVERFHKVLNANVISTFLCCKELLKQNDRPKSIVNVSSAASRTGAPFAYIDYAASKGAVDSFTKGLALELAEKGTRVNAVRPGFIYTDMHIDTGEPNRVDRLAPQIPMKRGGTAEEVANTVVWLLSDEASYITGTFVDVSGGR